MQRLIVTPKTITLTGRTTPQLMVILNKIEGRRAWLKDGNGLRVEYSEHNLELLSKLPNIAIDDHRMAAEFDPGAAPAPRGPRASYEFKTEPYPHQHAALGKFYGKDIMALFLDQGLGKTKTFLDWASMLYRSGEITGVIVVSKNGVHHQWIDSEIPTHFCGEWSGQAWPFKFVRNGPGLQFITVNWESVRTPKAFNALLEFAINHKGKLLFILDESHKAKNPDAKATQAVFELKPYSSHRAILTGTPVAVSLEDEKTQLDFLDESIIGVKYRTTFRAEYCVMGGFNGKQIVGHKNIKKFRDKVDPWTIRVTKEEAGLLPKQYNEWIFNLEKPQKEMIKEIKADLRATMPDGEIIRLDKMVSTMIKVQQASNGFFIDQNGEIVRLLPVDKNPRAVNMMQWIDALEGGKAIIWHNFREDARIAASVLDQAGIHSVQYHGGVGSSEKKEAVRSFLDPDGAKIFLANPTSAGTGLNLQGTSNYTLYYSNGTNSIDRWQSEDRNHRIGMVGTVTYTDLIARGSADRRLVMIQKNKDVVKEMACGDFIKLFFDDDDLE